MMSHTSVLREELARIRPAPPSKSNGSNPEGTPPPGRASECDCAPLPFSDAADLEAAAAANLCGLALSGGGIRSATFNLGVLQALAELKLLSRIDYLSTVSGGGYIGAWLTALVHRHGGIEAVEARLAKSVREPEAAVRFLREHSNYLTPRTGFFGADTWSAISIYLRNMTLNLAVLVGVLVAALLVPPLLLPWFERVAAAAPPAWILGAASLASVESWVRPSGLADWLAFLCFLPAVIMAGTNLRYLDNCGGEAAPARRLAGQFAVLGGIIVPALAGAFFIAASTWEKPPADILSPTPDVPWATFLVFVSAWWVSLWLVLVVCWHVRRAGPVVATAGRSPSVWRLGGAALISAVFSGVLAAALVGVVDHADLSVTDAATWMTVGPPLAIAIVSFSAVLNIGLMGRYVSEEVREWWARVGAWLLIASLAWMGLCLISFFGPRLLDSIGRFNIPAAAAWLATTGLGLLAGRSATTQGAQPGSNRIREAVCAIAPYVFLIGLLLLLSWLTAWGLRTAFTVAPDSALVIVYRCGLDTWCKVPWWHTLWVCLGALAIALALSWRVDINAFSLQPLYRNRLVRCYLGASHQPRSPHPFTGFDPRDDIGLAALADPARSLRPYPLVNVALNLVKGEELAWQERKAAAFTLAPLHCGFNNTYRRTAEYAGGELTLGEAFATSGAAASPNMGYHSNPALAFLMTIFNVRLGRWLGNPKSETCWTHPGPRLALLALLSELFGNTNERARFVYLSDGGHFDNLGLYELLRRRCRFIIACDASADPKVRFDDLGSAIRKCRTDFGIDITLDTTSLRLDPQGGHSRGYCAVAHVEYADHSIGTVLYLKAALTGREAVDVLNYAAGDATFPHQSTADQWFSESQFESYRRLGYQCARTVLETAAKRLADEAQLEGVFIDLRERWYPPTSMPDGTFARHTARLDALTERLRANEHLSFLDAQIVPSWKDLMAGVAAAPAVGPWIPAEADARRAGFYFCSSLLQLMESVYVDQGLEMQFEHPDNRGWMNLFRHWSWCGMLRVTWALTAATYGARFQSFCRDRLHLTVGEIVAVRAEVAELNFVEQELAEQVMGAGQLYAIRLRVPDPAAVATKSGNGIEFPVGFAVVEEKELRYLRVQDQLRKMGLARQALSALLREAEVQRIAADEAPRSPFEPSNGKTTLERIFNSVRAERKAGPSATA